MQAAIAKHELGPRIDAILKASGAPQVKYRKIKPPQLLTRLRAGGARAYELDLRRQLAGAYEATPRSDFWFGFADNQLLMGHGAVVWAVSRRRNARSPVPSLSPGVAALLR